MFWGDKPGRIGVLELICWVDLFSRFMFLFGISGRCLWISWDLKEIHPPDGEVFWFENHCLVGPDGHEHIDPILT